MATTTAKQLAKAAWMNLEFFENENVFTPDEDYLLKVKDPEDGEWYEVTQLCSTADLSVTYVMPGHDEGSQFYGVEEELEFTVFKKFLG